MTQLALIIRQRSGQIGRLVDDEVAESSDRTQANGQRHQDRDHPRGMDAPQSLHERRQQERHQDRQRQGDEHVLRDSQDRDDHDYRQQNGACGRYLA